MKTLSTLPQSRHAQPMIPTSGVTPEEACVRERRRDYEMMFIISPLHSNEESVTATIERVKHVISNEGGEVTAVNQNSPWGRRKLAYPIRAYAGGEASRRNFSEGYYVLMHFSLSSSKVVELDRSLKLNDTILRHLVIVIEKPSPSPSNSTAPEAIAEA